MAFQGQQLMLSVFDEITTFIEETVESAPKPDFPKYAVYRGGMCRVLYYEDNGMFRILDKGDRQMSVHRDRLSFVRPKKKV